MIQGLGSYGTCSRGKILQLQLLNSALLTFDPLVKLCCHDLYGIKFWKSSFTESDAALLQTYISPGRRLKLIKINDDLL